MLFIRANAQDPEEDEMETKTQGYNYNEVDRYAPVTVIAKAMREEIKNAKSNGLLPTNWKYSVTCHHGSSINIQVESFGEAWIASNEELCISDFLCCPNSHHAKRCPAGQHLTDEAEAAEMTLERIHQSYNHDNSDIQTDYFDVRYYGQVSFKGGF